MSNFKDKVNNGSCYRVDFFFSKNNPTPQSQIFPAFLCTPTVLDAICFSHRALFVTCEKYGCRQFNPWPNHVRPEIYDNLDIFFETNETNN